MSDRHGSLLLPSLRRRARGHPDHPRRERGAQPDRDRHRIAHPSLPRRTQCRYQCPQGASLTFTHFLCVESEKKNLGTDLEYLGGGRRAAVVGVDERNRTRDGDRDSTFEDRRLCAGSVGRLRASRRAYIRADTRLENHHILK